MLSFCIAQGFDEIVASLIQHGSAVNILDKENGMTPLIQAAKSGSLRIVELLLKNGADPTLKDMSGRTAADTALIFGHPEVTELIHKYEIVTA